LLKYSSFWFKTPEAVLTQATEIWRTHSRYFVLFAGICTTPSKGLQRKSFLSCRVWAWVTERLEHGRQNLI